jgi:hypothetical protein
MSKTVDLGAGHTVARHHVPHALLAQFDEASAALSAAQASIRSSVQLVALQAPAAFSGSVSCTSQGQSGMTYNLSEVGGALFADERDVAIFTMLEFMGVPTVQPQSNLRAGLVFQDTAAGSFMRYDGATWAPVTLI